MLHWFRRRTNGHSDSSRLGRLSGFLMSGELESGWAPDAASCFLDLTLEKPETTYIYFAYYARATSRTSTHCPKSGFLRCRTEYLRRFPGSNGRKLKPFDWLRSLVGTVDSVQLVHAGGRMRFFRIPNFVFLFPPALAHSPGKQSIAPFLQFPSPCYLPTRHL